jgi:hypothetical protein
MKILSLTSIFVLLLLTYSSAQYNPGAKQISLANSDVALSNDVFSLFGNPAGLSQMNWRELGIYYSPAPFGITEMANGFVAYHEPTTFGSFAVGGMTYGFELYRESKIKAGYSYNYLNTFFAGIGINYHTFSIQGYGNQGVLYLDIGGLTFLTNDFRIGFFIHNFNRASLAGLNDQIPSIINVGLSHDFLEKLSANLSVEKDIRYNPSLQFGVDYDIIEYLSIRAGFSNQPSRYSAGVGINYSIFSLEYSFFSHTDLGLTHQAGVIVSFGKNSSRIKMIKNYLGIE